MSVLGVVSTRFSTMDGGTMTALYIGSVFYDACCIVVCCAVLWWVVFIVIMMLTTVTKVALASGYAYMLAPSAATSFEAHVTCCELKN